MNKKRTVFLTGATGLLGSYLLKILLENKNKVYALARNKNGKTAQQRIIESVRFWVGSTTPHILKNLTIVEGDIAEANLGIKTPIRVKKLISNIEIEFSPSARPFFLHKP